MSSPEDKLSVITEAITEELGKYSTRYMSTHDIALVLGIRLVNDGWNPPEEPFVEEWRLIPGYSFFEASNRGLIRHALTKNQIEMVSSNLGEPITVTIHDNGGMEETLALEDILVKTFPKGKTELTEEEWRTVEGIGTNSFEINRLGTIRHKSSGRVQEPKYDEFYQMVTVKLIVNGKPVWIDGPTLAETMWANG
jgi:hypothetical protein